MLYEGVREDEKSGEWDWVYLAQGKVPQQVKIPKYFLSVIIEYHCILHQSPADP
jgi:hypothetical protein